MSSGCANWLEGNTVRFTATITDILGAPVTPLIVSLLFLVEETGVVTTRTGGDITDLGGGVYQRDEIMDTSGTIKWRWETYSPSSAIEGSFVVQPSEVLP